MKHIKLLVGVMALIIFVLRMAEVSAQNHHQENGNEFGEREEIRQTFRLAPDARVEVSGIQGSVEIETANIEVAEINIVRSAQSRKDLEEYKIGIKNDSQSLSIRGETRRSNSGDGFGPDVHHQVKIRLPFSVNLSIKNIAGEVLVGDVGGNLSVGSVGGSLVIGAVNGRLQINVISGGVTVGRVGGQIEIKSVGGNVKIAQTVDYLNISVVTGTVSVGIAALEKRGVEINSISGQVELQIKDKLNAQLITNNVSGKVSIEIPNVTVQSRPNAYAMSALIGKGGSPISINVITSDVRFVRSK